MLQYFMDVVDDTELLRQTELASLDISQSALGPQALTLLKQIHHSLFQRLHGLDALGGFLGSAGL